MPNVFEGDISAEEEVLDWLIEMKVESHIELITRSMLEAMVDEVQYLAVFFCECFVFLGFFLSYSGSDSHMYYSSFQSSKIAARATKFWQSWKISVR